MSSSSSASSSSAVALRRLGRVSQQLNPHPTAHHLDQISVAPPDEIFNTGIRFKADTDKRKINLGVGAYRTDAGQPLVLNVVREAERRIAADQSLNKEYLPIDGDAKFVAAARDLLFGAQSPALREKRMATVQSLSGTGALRVGCEFIQKYLPKGTTIYYSNPTWGNHLAIFTAAGLPSAKYRYWDAAGRCLNLSGMLADLRAAPSGSVVLLHACAHNPTGVDPTRDQWKQIAAVCKEKNHLPFFDCAYQGFASGSLENDAWALRYFVSEGFELLCAQSFAKNLGLYNERVGTLSVVCSSSQQAVAVLSQVKLIIRRNYSNPPSHGARVAATVLTDPQLFAQWQIELSEMSGRIIRMREALFNALVKLGTPGDWRHITSQIGMFSFTGLTPAQCATLSDKHHIYLLKNGRISMSGINASNVQYLANCIDDVVRNVKQ